MDKHIRFHFRCIPSRSWIDRDVWVWKFERKVKMNCCFFSQYLLVLIAYYAHCSKGEKKMIMDPIFVRHHHKERFISDVERNSSSNKQAAKRDQLTKYKTDKFWRFCLPIRRNINETIGHWVMWTVTVDGLWTRHITSDVLCRSQYLSDLMNCLDNRLPIYTWSCFWKLIIIHLFAVRQRWHFGVFFLFRVKSNLDTSLPIRKQRKNVFIWPNIAWISTNVRCCWFVVLMVVMMPCYIRVIWTFAEKHFQIKDVSPTRNDKNSNNKPFQ
jgi:hypothetical protein